MLISLFPSNKIMPSSPIWYIHSKITMTRAGKKCLFPGKLTNFSTICYVFLCTKRSNSLQTTKFPSKSQHFPGKSFPNPTFFPHHNYLTHNTIQILTAHEGNGGKLLSPRWNSILAYYSFTEALRALVNSKRRLNFTEGTIIFYYSPNKRAVNICFIHPYPQIF